MRFANCPICTTPIDQPHFGHPRWTCGDATCRLRWLAREDELLGLLKRSAS